MSVAIVRMNKATKELHRIPVSTSQSFRTDWISLSTSLGFKLIPLMQDPYMLDDDMKSSLVDELKQLRAYIESLNDQRYEYIVGRIAEILPELEGYSCDEYEFVMG